MLRLCAYSEPIVDRNLAKNLLKGGVAGLTMGWKRDLGELEQPPLWLVFKDRHRPLTEVPAGVHEIWWEDACETEQLVFTDKAVFMGINVYPIGSGITRVTPAHLKDLQRYLIGAGLRIMAYGDHVDPNVRKYQPLRSTEKVALAHPGGLPLLGQVDLETGEIWPLPPDMTSP